MQQFSDCLQNEILRNYLDNYFFFLHPSAVNEAEIGSFKVDVHMKMAHIVLGLVLVFYSLKGGERFYLQTYPQ